MKRYRINTDKLINRLVPHFLDGRRYILFLQSLVYPLMTLNERFTAFAREKHIQARMTSQVMYLEWYLNYKFGRYLSDKADRIFISETSTLGVDIYHERAASGKPFTIWLQGEKVEVADPQEAPREFYRKAEEKTVNKVSFMVNVPPVTIPTPELVYMISFAVNTYKIAGKTYLIKMDGEEIKPNK